MKTLFFFLLSSACFSQCPSPILISKNGIVVIDNYASGLYVWYWTNGKDTTMLVKENTSLPNVPYKINKGDRVWLMKYCPQLPTVNMDEGINFINYYNVHKLEGWNWSTSNTVIY